MKREKINQEKQTTKSIWRTCKEKKKINKTHKIIKKRNRGNLRRRGFLANTEPT